MFHAIMTFTRLGVTFAAWRPCNEKRDIAPVRFFGGLCGARAAISAIL